MPMRLLSMEWYIKSGFEEYENDYKVFNPHYPVGVDESSSEASNKRKRTNEQVTPLKKIGSLSASVLNNPLVKKLVINIQQDFSADEKLFLSPEQVRTDLECEMDSIFRALKETIVENAMSQHFNARIDRSCSKNLLDYFVGVASSKQAETLASIGNTVPSTFSFQEYERRL